MLKQIIDTLKASGADAWEVTETVEERWEFYLIRGALDQNRAVRVKHCGVRVFRWSGDGQFLGSAAGEIPPTADAAEIRRQIDQMLLAASLVKNPAYTLNAPEAETSGRTEAAPASPEEISAAFLSALRGVPETESFFNCWTAGA